MEKRIDHGAAHRGRTLLGVWAHPDDEAYLSAGLMAAHCQRGDRVVVVTATLGEHGTSDPALWPPTRLRAVRAGELRDSLAVLGVSELHLLGFEDGTCHRRDGTALIAGIIAEVEPDLILTFGPDGLTGHDDHRAVSEWTTRAWSSTNSDADLWYATLTADFYRRWGHVSDSAGLWIDRRRAPLCDREDLVHGAPLTDTLLDRKVAALQAHASQTGPLIERLGMPTYREWWRVESFRRADAAFDRLELRDAS